MRIKGSITFDDPKAGSFSIFETALQFKQMPADEDASDDTEGCYVEIDMLRTGKFIRKSWFGESLITIDEAMMDTMIKNFNDGVMSSGVSLDTNHRGEEAYGWLKSIRKEQREVKGKMQTFMVGKYELTPDGKEIINNQTYKFFSIEFVPNMSQKEVHETTKTPEGREIPTGDIKSYGPVITGGALTNRPFIPDMKAVPMAFSDGKPDPKNELSKFDFIPDEEVVVLNQEHKSSGGSSKAVVNFNQSNKSEKIIPKNSNIDTPKSFFSGFSFKKESNMKFDAIKKNIKFMEEKLSKTEKNSSEFSEVNDLLSAMRIELTEAEKEMKEKEDAVKNSDAAIKDLNTQYVALENTVKQTSQQLKLSNERARQSDVNSYCTELSRQGYAKPTVEKIKEYLLADTEEAVVLHVMFGEDKNQKKPLKLKEIFSELLSTLPEEAKVPEGELSLSNRETVEIPNPDNSKKKKFANKEERELSEFEDKFGDAINAGHKAAVTRHRGKSADNTKN